MAEIVEIEAHGQVFEVEVGTAEHKLLLAEGSVPEPVDAPEPVEQATPDVEPTEVEHPDVEHPEGDVLK